MGVMSRGILLQRTDYSLHETGADPKEDTVSDTPRTDAVVRPGETITVGDPASHGGYYLELPEMVPADFARKLEREIAELQTRLMHLSED